MGNIVSPQERLEVSLAGAWLCVIRSVVGSNINAIRPARTERRQGRYLGSLAWRAVIVRLLNDGYDWQPQFPGRTTGVGEQMYRAGFSDGERALLIRPK